jgi:hypothetical protein
MKATLYHKIWDKIALGHEDVVRSMAKGGFMSTFDLIEFFPPKTHYNFLNQSSDFIVLLIKHTKFELFQKLYNLILILAIPVIEFVPI